MTHNCRNYVSRIIIYQDTISIFWETFNHGKPIALTISCISHVLVSQNNDLLNYTVMALYRMYLWPVSLFWETMILKLWPWATRNIEPTTRLFILSPLRPPSLTRCSSARHMTPERYLTFISSWKIRNVYYNKHKKDQMGVDLLSHKTWKAFTKICQMRNTHTHTHSSPLNSWLK